MQDYFFCKIKSGLFTVVFFVYPRGGGKIKRKLTTLPRIFYAYLCVNLTRMYSQSNSSCAYRRSPYGAVVMTARAAPTGGHLDYSSSASCRGVRMREYVDPTDQVRWI